MTDGNTSGAQALPEGAALAPRRTAVRPWIVAALCVLASVLVGLWWVLGADQFRTIAEGSVYQSGVLAPDDLREKVRQFGIRTVIDLREPWDEVKGEREALSAQGVQHIHLPTGQIPEDGTVSRFLDLMSNPATYPVLIHCEHGTGRSVLFSAIYRIEFQGWEREQARLATRPALRWLVPGASFAVGAPKGDYLLTYALRRHPAAGASEPARTEQSR